MHTMAVQSPFSKSSPQKGTIEGIVSLEIGCCVHLWACMCINHPRAGLPLDGWKSCIIIWIITTIIVVFITINIIMPKSGACSSVYIGSEKDPGCTVDSVLLCWSPNPAFGFFGQEGSGKTRGKSPHFSCSAIPRHPSLSLEGCISVIAFSKTHLPEPPVVWVTNESEWGRHQNSGFGLWSPFFFQTQHLPKESQGGNTSYLMPTSPFFPHGPSYGFPAVLRTGINQSWANSIPTGHINLMLSTALWSLPSSLGSVGVGELMQRWCLMRQSMDQWSHKTQENL